MKPFAGVQVLIATVAILVTGSGTLSAGTNVWTSLGPEGGRIERLVVDPQSPSTLYAVAGDGVFKTTNGGRTWSRLAISGLASARELAIDPQHPSTLYAVANARGLKSTDGGMSWSELSSFPARTAALAVDPRSGAVYARTCAGVARSTDGGESWRETVFPPPFTCMPMLAINPSTGALYTTRVVYTPDGHGTDRTGSILKSADGGESWSVLDLGVTSVAALALAFDPQNSNTIYALARGSLPPTANQSGTWIFKTTDGGASWVNSTALDVGGDVLVVDPQNPSTVYAANRSVVLRSTDGGTSWNSITLELPGGSEAYRSPSRVTTLAIAPPASPAAPARSRAGTSRTNSSTLYAGTYSRGVLKSPDEGNTWTAVNSGLIATDIGNLLIDPQDPRTLYGVQGGVEIIKSSDAGTSWRSATPGVPGTAWLGPLAIDPHNPATVYVATDWRGVFKTTDGGTSWKVASSGLPGAVASLAIDPQNSSTLYAGIGDEWCWEGICFSSGVFKSLDGGASWSDSGLSKFWVGGVVVDPQNSSAIYATGFLPRLAGGASEGWGWGSPSFFNSTDGGRSWDVVSLPVPSITGLAIDPQKPSTAYAYGGSLLKTTDGGKSWSEVDLASVRTLAIDPQAPSTLYAGTDSGVFRSADGGASWTAVNSGLTSLSIATLAIDPRNPSTVFAGTSGGGVFSITLPSQKQ